MLRLDPIALLATNQQIIAAHRDRSRRFDQVAIGFIGGMKMRDVDLALPEHPEHIALVQVLEPGETAAFVRHREPFSV